MKIKYIVQVWDEQDYVSGELWGTITDFAKTAEAIDVPGKQTSSWLTFTIDKEDEQAVDRFLAKSKKVVRDINKSKNLHEDVDQQGEDLGTVSATTSADAANTEIRVVPDCFHRNLPCFTMETDEFHSFSKGVKSFRLWNQHTKSEDVRMWARQNRGKDFYVQNGENYMKVSRAKRVMESEEETAVDGVSIDQRLAQFMIVAHRESGGSKHAFLISLATKTGETLTYLHRHPQVQDFIKKNQWGTTLPE